jgi:Domain of unknown function (DUF5666)
MLRVIAVAVLSFFVLTTGVDAGDKAKGKKPAGKVEGTITAVGASSVTIRARSGGQVTVGVTATTKIERNDRHVSLSAFKVGDRGEALFNPTTRVASKVEAVGR